MRIATKIELYDAGVVLYNQTAEKDLEFSGYDYSHVGKGYGLGNTFLEILETAGVIGHETNLQLEDPVYDRPILRQVFERVIYCRELLADELTNGNLKILANATHGHDCPEKGDYWTIDTTYRGNYSIFWNIREI